MRISTFNRQWLSVVVLLVLFPWHDLLSMENAEPAANRGYYRQLLDRDGRPVGCICIGSADVLAAAIRSGQVEEYVRSAIEVDLTLDALVAKEANAIATLRTVENLSVGHFPEPTAVSNDALAELFRMTSLRSLSMYLSSSAKLDFTPIENLRDLISLEIGGEVLLHDEDLRRIAKLRQLNHLVLQGEIQCENFSWLLSLDKLRSLTIRAPSSRDGLVEGLSRLSSLESLCLYQAVISSADISQIAKGCGQSLQELDVRVNILDPEFLSQCFPNLEVLTVRSDITWECDLSGFRKVNKLKSLTIPSFRVNDDEFSKLRGHTNLKVLRLGNANLSMAAVDVLSDFPALQELHLSGEAQSASVKAAASKLLERRIQNEDLESNPQR